MTANGARWHPGTPVQGLAGAPRFGNESVPGILYHWTRVFAFLPGA